MEIPAITWFWQFWILCYVQGRSRSAEARWYKRWLLWPPYILLSGVERSDKIIPFAFRAEAVLLGPLV
jgi:hypothetical protein